MNVTLLENILGRLLMAFSVTIAIPLMVALFYRETAMWSFLISLLITALVGAIMFFHGKIDGKIGVRDSFAVVGGAWIFASLFGALPFIISGVVPTYIDALFETVSGLTTTGASVLTDLELLPRSILLWRSLLHWIGGMGIIVMFIVLLPNLGIGNARIFYSETPGPIDDKIVPRIKDTATILWRIYFGLTVINVLLLLAAGMSLFDAINHAFATMATGGFSTRTASIEAYNSIPIELITAGFMLIAGSNFSLFIQVWKQRSLKPLRDAELKCYLLIVSISIVIIAASLVIQQGVSSGPALRDSVFQTASIMTTTGFASTDFDQWPGIAKMVLFFLMFIGASAGSTAGGIKVSRILLLVKMGLAQLKQAIHPRLVVNIVVQDRVVDSSVLTNVGRFFFVYFLTFALGSLLVAGTGLEPFDAMSASIATLSSIGPGFGVVGPMYTYASLHPFAKGVLTVLMLLGRLELFTLLVFLQPDFWRVKRTNKMK
ncbi:TrkH family potassium uptake protein [Dehalobacter sp. DCM]|uniref:TrkH family potassium uptake protein n=1 Tax=Dehalobacter sp. DCM TaxID=2907827 RepID=UPI003081976A|nr:TrkH family potassium uptake protein [Dehalobacter sp. DCM]